MVLIECFTELHMDNMASCLRLQPETMILLGDAAQMEKPVQRYKELLRQREQETKIDTRDVGQKDLAGIQQELAKIIAEEDQYVIDLTGGEELVIMAVGALVAGLEPHKRKTVQVQTYDYQKGLVYDNLHGNMSHPCEEVTMSVKQLLLLNGATTYREEYQPPASSSCKELAGLWALVAENPKDWNQSIALLNAFESRVKFGMHICLTKEQIRGISKSQEKLPEMQALLQRMHNNGVIQMIPRKDGALEYRYRSDLLRYCTLKAGNALEVKTLLEGRRVRENGKRFFTASRMSVHIDWDGILNKQKQGIPDTRNEIDVVLMRGLTPLFISCKNGKIGEEELYKLHTVATQFGGPHARKMLIATDLDQKSTGANRSFIQRAWDMDIFLVTDGADLSATAWRDTFKQVMQ